MITLVLIIVSATLIVLLVLYRRHQLWQASCSISNDKTRCKSLECARCNQHDDRIRYANEEFGRIINELPNQNSLDRVAYALENRSIKSDHILLLPFDRTYAIWNCNQLGDRISNDIRRLEHNYSIIASECRQMIDKGGDGWQVNNDDNTWRIFGLMNQGGWIDDNCVQCPQTTVILRHLQSLMTDCIFGNAFISVVSSSTTIHAHYGPTNIRLRCHLSIDVPIDQSCNCFMMIHDDNDQHHCIRWTNAKCLVFDDSMLHSVHYDSIDNRHRIVFICDIWHPDIDDTERTCLSRMFPSM